MWAFLVSKFDLGQNSSLMVFCFTYNMEQSSHYITYLDWITDHDIQFAQPFPEWVPDYTSTPKWCHENREKNSYHCLYFATIMQESGKWIGPPAKIITKSIFKPWIGPFCADGNHRVRACKYLQNMYGITINIPVIKDIGK